MEATIISIVSTVSAVVLRQLRDLRSPEDYVQELENGLRELRGRRDDVKARIDISEVEGETCTNEVSIWLERVRDADTKAARFIVRHARRRGLGRFTLGCMSVNSQSAASLLGDIKALSDQGRFETVAMRLPPDTVRELPVRSAQFGLQPYLDDVQRFLEDDRVNIMGIWGMGGVGKTTLLKSINNELLAGGQLRSEFNHVIWAVVSRDYKLEKLQESIAKNLGLVLADAGDVETRASAITNFLGRKNFLLLLDDLWEPVDLEMIGIPQRRPGGRPVRKVIFTTRSHMVCNHMDAKTKLRMRCLEPGDAWRLFKESVGGEVAANPTLRFLAEQVVKECDGLPLALITIGRAMASKKTRDEWERTIELLQQSRLHEIADEDDSMAIQRIYQKLIISYKSLPADIARQCFLCCALWPEDHHIEKLELVQSWMGLGLLNELTTVDIAQEKGYSVIRTLEAACLLEPVLDSENKVKMHDVIRDMALWIANENGTDMNKWIVKAGGGLTEAFNDVESLKGAQRISLMLNGLIELTSVPDCPKLSSLMLQRNRRLRRIHHDFFRSMAALTFLDLSSTNIYEIPEGIGSLLNLLYLNLSNTPISSLPATLRNLTKLKLLLLSNTSNLREIPYGLISSLSMLVVLDLFGSGFADWEEADDSDTNCLKDGSSSRRKRASFQEFKQLTQGLQSLGVTIETFGALNQLSDIARVSTQRLGIIGWVGAESLQQLMGLLRRPSIHHKLQVLRIENCGTSGALTIGGKGNDVNGESSRPAGAWSLPKLKVLELRNLMKLREIIWLGVEPQRYLPMIRELKISDCDKLEDVCWVLHLQHLEHLALSNCKCLKQIVYDDPGTQVIVRNDDPGGEAEEKQGPFCGLKMLLLEKLPLLHSICDQAYDFSCLESLEVKECQMLGELPFRSEIIKNKSLVIRGEDDWWNNLVLRHDEVGNIKDVLRFSKF